MNLAKNKTYRYKNRQTQIMWNHWKARAKLAQEEINDLKKEEIKYKEKHGQLIGKIHVLEKKLARYENPDYVLVPRELNGNIIEDMWSTFDKRPDMQLIHNAMIEAVEKEHAEN